MRYAFLVALCAGAFPTLADDWPVLSGRDPGRNCLSLGLGPTDPTILWSGGRSAIVSQQGCCVGNILVTNRIGSFNLPDGTLIVAQELSTGVELWATNIPAEFGDSWRSRVTGFRDGHVYATRSGNTNKEYLYALDPATGNIIWRSQALIDESTTESINYASNGDIVVGNFQSIVRINKTDGTTLWTVSRVSPTSDGSAVAIYGEKAYYWEATANGPKITALNLTTQAVYSSPPIGGGFVQQVVPFVGPDGTVYAPRTQNNVITDFLVAFTDTGTALAEKWRKPIGYVPFATFGVGPDGSVYNYLTNKIGNDAEMIVQRLDPATGQQTGISQPIPSNFPVMPRTAIDAAGKIYVTNGGFAKGALYSLNADLTVRWSRPLANVNLGGPILGNNGALVVCGTGMDVRAYSTYVPASLTGAVNLTLYDGDLTGKAGNIEFRTPGSTDVLHTYPISMAADGSYAVASVEQGTFDLALKMPRFLRQVLSDTSVVGGSNAAIFTQINGDLDNNNAVDVLDLNLVLIHFAQADPAFDLNGDGFVDLLELNIVFVNFSQQGQP